MKLLINNFHVDWENSESHCFFNPKHPLTKSLRKKAKELPYLKSHIYLWTSNFGKICMISKHAFLESAQAVNKHLQTTKKDIWLLCLPLFHVAGLSILARQFCGGFSVARMDLWSPQKFKKSLKKSKASLCSLVPSQLYDLVNQNLSPPSSLRALIIGGDSLPPPIYKRARELGWPVLISYGLTETCSQIACAPLSSLKQNSFPAMRLLSHVFVKNRPARVKSSSLLTAFFDPEKKQMIQALDSKGFFKLPDRVLFKEGRLIFKGRKEEEIKVLGERLNFKKLSELLARLSQNFKKEYHLLAVPSERRGQKLVLMTDSFNFDEIFSLVKDFNKRVMVFERVQAIYLLSFIKKSQLSKFRQKTACEQLAF